MAFLDACVALREGKVSNGAAFCGRAAQRGGDTEERCDSDGEAHHAVITDVIHGVQFIDGIKEHVA